MDASCDAVIPAITQLRRQLPVEAYVWVAIPQKARLFQSAYEELFTMQGVYRGVRMLPTEYLRAGNVTADAARENMFIEIYLNNNIFDGDYDQLTELMEGLKNAGDGASILGVDATLVNQGNILGGGAGNSFTWFIKSKFREFRITVLALNEKKRHIHEYLRALHENIHLRDADIKAGMVLLNRGNLLTTAWLPEERAVLQAIMGTMAIEQLSGAIDEAVVRGRLEGALVAALLAKYDAPQDVLPFQHPSDRERYGWILLQALRAGIAIPDNVGTMDMAARKTYLKHVDANVDDALTQHAMVRGTIAMAREACLRLCNGESPDQLPVNLTTIADELYTAAYAAEDVRLSPACMSMLMMLYSLYLLRDERMSVRIEKKTNDLMPAIMRAINAAA
jgi:hypothetical protein